ncbi:MAG: hypothetical protein QOI12_3681 [Alphaproteobacteria bacterium]|nr:hypothetical protein [Alphaproteobacteria bacterium]
MIGNGSANHCLILAVDYTIIIVWVYDFVAVVMLRKFYSRLSVQRKSEMDSVFTFEKKYRKPFRRKLMRVLGFKPRNDLTGDVQWQA